MKLTAQVLYEFDKFRLNPAEQLLLCDDKPVPLTPKAFQILCVLLQSKGRLLDKDDLIKRVWPNSFVEEANLSVNISALRKALGDTPNGQKFIATVPKRGYRFVMPVREIQGVSQTETKPEDLIGASEPAVSGDGGVRVQTEAATPSRTTSVASRAIGIGLALALVVLIYFAYRRHPVPSYYVDWCPSAGRSSLSEYEP